MAAADPAAAERRASTEIVAVTGLLRHGDGGRVEGLGCGGTGDGDGSRKWEDVVDDSDDMMEDIALFSKEIAWFTEDIASFIEDIGVVHCLLTKYKRAC